MIRSIVAVIVSFIAMFGLTMVVFSGLWYGMGPDTLLQPASFRFSMLLAVAIAAITVIRGLIGGWMCAKIGRGTKPVMVLAGLVLMIGMIVCYSTLKAPELTDVRGPGMTTDQFFDKAREPLWLVIFNPIAGAAMVLIGGLCIASPRKPQLTLQ